ncbi:unnamed protein product [Microthlaspi erraticum]|uniref:DUF8039 domain-containing protein n=1 Tax=Microthlaspi erraticum TaxID=1685480 RepID=A0A6D2HXL2_9BRAS|nr:unnamed protein product [Microthlaspi erraticum]
MDSTANDNIRKDAVSQVLGKDKPGRIRGIGRGITATKLAFIQLRDSHVQKLKATQAELLCKFTELQNKSQCNDVGSQSDVSDISKGGPRCQILNWFADEDVIVSEGEFYSAEPNYKIGHIPLGPNAASVIVTSALDPETSVWRPTSSVFNVDQAVGVKIAWPMSKIILDTELVSSNGDKFPGSTATSTDESLQLCSIFDWNAGEVVAEGLLQSTDPKEMVNNIPLGPNAAVLKITKVIKNDAYLWRPSAEMFLMGAAVDTTIAWPIHKIEFVVKATQAESARKSTTSASNSTGTRKNQAKRCILLDCKNSGERVALGRVSSSDPEDVVHFIPLGPNASKVWVDVSKIGISEVWIPNSEIKFIRDAVGTTIAWPNDKIIFM